MNDENDERNPHYPEEASASKIFEELIREEHRKATEPKTYISHSGITPEQQTLLDKWLQTPEFKQEYKDVAENEERVVLGVVTSIENYSGQIHVKYLSDRGMPMGFVWNKDDKDLFGKVGEEGFKEGQIIASELNGYKMKSVYPLDLEGEEKLELLEKMKNKYENFRKNLNSE